MKTVPDWIFWAFLAIALGIASVQFLVGWSLVQSNRDRKMIHQNQAEVREALRVLDGRSEWLDRTVRQIIENDRRRREARK